VVACGAGGEGETRDRLVDWGETKRGKESTRAGPQKKIRKSTTREKKLPLNTGRRAVSYVEHRQGPRDVRVKKSVRAGFRRIPSHREEGIFLWRGVCRGPVGKLGEEVVKSIRGYARD